jgi:hypothetical protein
LATIDQEKAGQGPFVNYCPDNYKEIGKYKTEKRGINNLPGSFFRFTNIHYIPRYLLYSYVLAIAYI